MDMTTTNPHDYVHGYGRNWTPGLLVDHVTAFEAAGGTIRTPAHGLCEYAVCPDGSTVKVVCGDIIEIRTEDGPTTGRCGLPVRAGASACAGHQRIIDMTDDEFARYERSA